MALGPNDEVVIIACEALRLENEFDNAIKKGINVSLIESGGIAVKLTTNLPDKNILTSIASIIELKYEDAGWTTAVMGKCDDSSLVLILN
jgi:hypothetical protein